MTVAVTAPPTAACCLDLPAGMHAIVWGGKCLACLPVQPTVRDDDDRGDHIVKQSGGIRRDRYQRVVG